MSANQEACVSDNGNGRVDWYMCCAARRPTASVETTTHIEQRFTASQK